MKILARVFKILNEQGLGYLFKKILSKIMRERINNFVSIVS